MFATQKICFIWFVSYERVKTQVLWREEWLKLFEQDQSQSHFILLRQLLNWNTLDLLNVQMQIFLRLKNALIVLEQIVKELSHQQGCSLVLLLCHIELLLKLTVVHLQSIVLLLLNNKTLLMLFQFAFQEVYQVFTALGVVGQI